MSMDYRTVIGRWLGPTIPKEYEAATAANLVEFLGAQGYAVVDKDLLWSAATTLDKCCCEDTAEELRAAAHDSLRKDHSP